MLARRSGKTRRVIREPSALINRNLSNEKRPPRWPFSLKSEWKLPRNCLTKGVEDLWRSNCFRYFVDVRKA